MVFRSLINHISGCDTGYIRSFHSEGQSPIIDASIRLNCRDFDFDSTTRTAAESEMDAFPWGDLTNLVSYEHIPDAYNEDYMEISGLTPCVYLLPVDD